MTAKWTLRLSPKYGEGRTESAIPDAFCAPVAARAAKAGVAALPLPETCVTH
jgi:hypothetical protein